MRVQFTERSGRSLEALIAGAEGRNAIDVKRLLAIWQERERNGFEIDGPGELIMVTLDGVNQAIRMHRFLVDTVVGYVGIVPAPEGSASAVVLAVAFHVNQQQIDSAREAAIDNLRAWVGER